MRVFAEVPQASADSMHGAAARARLILRQSSYPALWTVSCQQTGGALILRGRVPLFYLKQIAQMLVAKAIDGVQILNQIEVVADEE